MNLIAIKVSMSRFVCRVGWLWATDQKAEQRTSKCTSKGYKTNERLHRNPLHFSMSRKDYIAMTTIYDCLCIYCIISARIDCPLRKSFWKSETQGESAFADFGRGGHGNRWIDCVVRASEMEAFKSSIGRR